MTEPTLRVRDLDVELLSGGGWRKVVDDVSFDVHAGETLGIVGESGSGKTITSLAVLGLLPKRTSKVGSGSIQLAGKELVGLRRSELEDLRGNEMSMIFQEPMTSLNPAFTVGAQIAEGVRRHRGCSRADAHKRAVEMLDLVGIPGAASRAKSYPYEMSGGMRQRVMIALAIASDPRLLIADEPTTALDVTIQAQILELLKRMQRELGLALVFITHNMGVVADVCDRVVVMYAGQVVEHNTVEEIFAHPRQPYTSGLLRATPTIDRISGPLVSIPGRPPDDPAAMTGCRFEPRCPFAVEACAHETVALVTGPEGEQHRCIRADELHLAIRPNVGRP
ncbi:ABC transporter ATP-binding protein [Amycolatopsis pithecellobii]|uniref:ATP-binding cassette domain-containing protein n=1 Tax=Amycolatopsis pithecellobii TaxID=664692 RepID=A0A6N7Z035_9PSEU|nr:ABC transporter ATP-binding protein [Amycolatopsis pithecellobii]MTD57592.1 ATP-binding cassette domain-containing protein [Amycolatopsis pithecellobii]